MHTNITALTAKTIDDQNNVKFVAFLGPEGTFSHQAACLFLRSSALISQPSSSASTSASGISSAASQRKPVISYVLRAYPNISQIIAAVEKSEVAWGIVPVENSIEGSVNVTMDLLAYEQPIYIHKEIVLDIKHYLYSRMPSPEEVKTVMSHPQALAQCRNFLETRLKDAKIMTTESTAEAVRQVTDNRRGYAAIGSAANQDLYNVPVLCADIGDYPHNQTRFFVIANTLNPALFTQKTSLILTLEKDRPGGLYDILGEFAAQKINLSRIESRPAKKQLGSYIFFIDCEAGHNHPGLQLVLESLRRKKSLFKNLGSYPVC